MAGIFFARAFRSSRSFSGSSIVSKVRHANQSRSKVSSSLQRKVNTSSRRTSPSLLFATTSSRSNLLEPTFAGVTFPTGSILSNLQVSCLHVSAASCDDGSSTGVAVDEAGSEASDNTVDPLSNDLLLPDSGGGGADALYPFETAQDVLSSGMLDVPLSSLGLGGYTPVGLIQNVLDFAHLQLGLPWWTAIVAGTVIFRALVFPLMVKGQVNSAKLNAIKPELERLQEKLREVSNYQNPMAKAQVSMELQGLFQKHDCHPVKAIIAPLIQLPLFISFFLALRQMSYLPVESMKIGGLLWFPDLTAADPTFVLPVVCAATMLLTIETGAEAGMANPQMKMMKNVFRGMCFVMIPLTYKFPTGIFLYWMTSNAISLVQVFAMKAPAVKNYFGIPEPIIHPVNPNVKTGSFFENLKAGYKNAQEAAIVKHTEKMKEREYKSSLKDAYQETFEYNPRTKENEEVFKAAKENTKRKP